jgi:hypothetical protein
MAGNRHEFGAKFEAIRPMSEIWDIGKSRIRFGVSSGSSSNSTMLAKESVVF